MKLLKIGLLGSAGRMGKTIEELLVNDPNYVYEYGIEKNPRNKGPAAFYSASLIQEKAQNLDVWIDFTSPDFLIQNLSIFKALQRPLVSGTTGLSSEQKKELFDLGKSLPLLWAPNMSLGMAFFRKMLRSLENKTLGENDNLKIQGIDEFLIEELHHKHKKDKPSGTALEIEEVLKSSGATKILPTVSIRAGSALGTHKVFAYMQDEIITLEHVAQSRSVFAKGALFAAEWLVKQRPGVYTMDDVIGRE